MNLSEALDAALPEIPQARLTRSRPPRLDPDLIVREDVLDGEPHRWHSAARQVKLLSGFRPGSGSWPSFSMASDRTRKSRRPFKQRRACRSNRKKSGPSPSRWTSATSGTRPTRKKTWRCAKSCWRSEDGATKSKINVAHISFSAWDPDRYLGWVDRVAGRFIYSRWCVLVAVLLFVFETVVL